MTLVPTLVHLRREINHLAPHYCSNLGVGNAQIRAVMWQSIASVFAAACPDTFPVNATRPQPLRESRLQHLPPIQKAETSCLPPTEPYTVSSSKLMLAPLEPTCPYHHSCPLCHGAEPRSRNLHRARLTLVWWLRRTNPTLSKGVCDASACSIHGRILSKVYDLVFHVGASSPLSRSLIFPNHTSAELVRSSLRLAVLVAGCIKL